MLKDIIILVIILIIVDSIWLYLIKDKYSEQILNIQKEPLTVNLYSAAIVYFLIAYGLLYLTKNATNHEKIKMAFVFGITSYGIYDFTNGALLKNWDFNIAILDTIWGGILCSSSMYLFSKLF